MTWKIPATPKTKRAFKLSLGCCPEDRFTEAETRQIRLELRSGVSAAEAEQRKRKSPTSNA
jgi:hypothetical protein